MNAAKDMGARQKAAIKAWNVRVSADYSAKDAYYRAMQDLCSEVGGHRWCSLENCIEEIARLGEPEHLRRALGIYASFWKSEGAFRAMADLVREL